MDSVWLEHHLLFPDHLSDASSVSEPIFMFRMCIHLLQKCKQRAFPEDVLRSFRQIKQIWTSAFRGENKHRTRGQISDLSDLLFHYMCKPMW